MARPSLFTHRKFRTLARRLGSRAVAVGSLELLWSVANEAGDPLIGSAEDVEDIADWRGAPGELAAAMVETRFLDETPEGYVIHDHDHHCPSYVRRRRDREQARRVTGASATRHKRVTDAPLTPTPHSHLPSPISQELKTVPSPEATERATFDQRFEAFWATYPRKVGKPKAIQAFRALKVTDRLLELMLDALAKQCRWPQWSRDNGQFIPHPATWLHRHGWEDEPPEVAPIRGGPSYTSHDEWHCPHGTGLEHCKNRRECNQRIEMAAMKAEAS